MRSTRLIPTCRHPRAHGQVVTREAFFWDARRVLRELGLREGRSRKWRSLRTRRKTCASDDARGEEMRAWMVRYGPALRRYFAETRRAGRGRGPGAGRLPRHAGARRAATSPRRSTATSSASPPTSWRAAASASGWDWRPTPSSTTSWRPTDELSPERILHRQRARWRRLMTALNALPPRTGRGLRPAPLRGDDLRRDRAPHGRVGQARSRSFIARAVARVAPMVEGGMTRPLRPPSRTPPAPGSPAAAPAP